MINYVGNCIDSEFYPTPMSLAERMAQVLGDIYKKNQSDYVNVLEPSAGKGDLVKAVLLAFKKLNTYKTLSIDCLEIDSNLRQILTYNFSEQHANELFAQQKKITGKYGKVYLDTLTGSYAYTSTSGAKVFCSKQDSAKLVAINNEIKAILDSVNSVHIVGDDFLKFHSFAQYDLIIMNPPFSNGDQHLLKAISLMKYGGCIVCLLNAETLRNPYTESRKQLVQLLKKYNAKVEFLKNAFKQAERKTAVEVALIRLDIPVSLGTTSEDSLFDKVAKKRAYAEFKQQDTTDLSLPDFVKFYVSQYNLEVESGLELLKVYAQMKPHLTTSFPDPNGNQYYGDDDVSLVLNCGSHEATVNGFIRKVRSKYWKALLIKSNALSRLPSSVQAEYRAKVSSYVNYDFSEFNINALLKDINSRLKSSIEKSILDIFEKLTYEHAYYPECCKNRHYFNGWKTNKAWKVGSKVILPGMDVFSYSNYSVECVLKDIEGVLNFFNGCMTAELSSFSLSSLVSSGQTKNVPFKYFTVSFYKKGTAHITFTCPKLIERLNLFAAQNRNWLPPSYGKMAYEQMSSEEKKVVDSFQGAEEYAEFLKSSNPHLFDFSSGLLPLIDN